MANQAEKAALGLKGDASDEDVQEAIAKLVAAKEAAENAAELAATEAEQAAIDKAEAEEEAAKAKAAAEADVEEALRQVQEAEDRAASAASDPASDEPVPAVLPEGSFKVKHLRFEYRVEVPDAAKPGETTYVLREAKQGEIIAPQVQADIEKGRKHGAFFTDRELTLQGVKGGSSKAPGDKSDQELIDWLLNEHPSAADTVNAAGGDAHLAQRILDAESAATGGEPRQEVVSGFSTILNES